VVNEDDTKINLENAAKLQCYVATAFDNDDEMKKNTMKSMNEYIPRRPKTAAQKHEEAMNLKEWRDSQQRNRRLLALRLKDRQCPTQQKMSFCVFLLKRTIAMPIHSTIQGSPVAFPR